MTSRNTHRRSTKPLTGLRIILVLLLGTASVAQMARDWEQQLQELIRNNQLDAGLAVVEQRIAISPADLEAHGWRGRILAWKGRWPEAETEYRHVLVKAPSDIDVLTGLADVLLWQDRPQEALQSLDQANRLSPSNPEVLSRRARVLLALGRTEEARAQLREILRIDPHDETVSKTLKGLAPETRHELRLGDDIDTFNYTDTAQAQMLGLNSRWSPRWSTFFETRFYERFGEDAAKASGGVAFRFTARNWLSAGGAGANDHGVIPRTEAFFECGHNSRFQKQFIRGMEVAYQQHWFWYRGAHVLTAGMSQFLYLPREWTWALTVNGARSGFSGSGIEWVPSGSARLGFPLCHGLSGNVLFAVGSENFAQVDQIGRFSARTFGGGLRYRISPQHDISGYIASQDRSQGRVQNSYGLSYGIRF